MNYTDKIYVAGHRGLVGSAIVRALQKDGFSNLILKSHEELDLLDSRAVATFFSKEKPTCVFLAAAKVGGIHANKADPVGMLFDNLAIQNNVIKSAYESGVSKLLFLGSTCIYPRLAPQPTPESALLTGEFEETNKSYAIAKVAGIGLCQAYAKQYGAKFISVIPANCYGPGDSFDAEKAHVIPMLMRKFHDAKVSGASNVTSWGSGEPMREFLYSDDLASAALFLMEKYDNPEIINIGTGEEIRIKELAEAIKDVVGFEGEILWDASKPDGAPRRILDVQKLHALGWKHSVSLTEGLQKTYEWYRESNPHG